MSSFFKSIGNYVFGNRPEKREEVPKKPEKVRSNPREDEKKLYNSLSSPLDKIEEKQPEVKFSSYDDISDKSKDDQKEQKIEGLFLKDLKIPEDSEKYKAVFFTFSMETNTFEPFSTNATLLIYRNEDKSKRKNSKITYNLCIHGSDGRVYVDQIISNESQIRFVTDYNSIIWVAKSDQQIYPMSCRFFSEEDFRKVNKTIIKCLYETNNNEPWEKCADQDFLIKQMVEEKQEKDEKDDEGSDLDFESYDDEIEQKPLDERELKYINRNKNKVERNFARISKMDIEEEEEESEKEEEEEEESSFDEFDI